MADEVKEDYLKVIFHYGAYPLWKYLLSNFGINIVDFCKYVTKEEPVLVVKEVEIVTRVVTPSDKSFSDENNTDALFLLNSVNTVYKSLQTAIVDKNEVQVLKDYNFTLDDQKNMYLVDLNGDRVTEDVIAVMYK